MRERICLSDTYRTLLGILNWTRTTNWHLNSEDPTFEYLSTNPCQPKGEFVLTRDGFKKIEDIYNEIHLEGKNYKSTPMFKTGISREIYKVILENGTEIRMTDNHRITTPNGDIELRNLDVGDKVSVDYSPVHTFNDLDTLHEIDYEKGIMLGFLVADGGIYNENDNEGYIGFSLGESEFEVENIITEIIRKYDSNFTFKPHHQKPTTCKQGRIFRNETIEKILKELKIIDKYNKFDIDFYSMSKEMKLGFLRALFTCDGSSRCEGVATLYSINKDFLAHIQRLLKEFGVYSTVTLHNNKRTYTAKDDMVRNNSATYKISCYDVEFKKIGFLTNYKNKTMNEGRVRNSTVLNGKKQALKISSIEYDGVEDVYDITVDEVHHYNTNGLIVHNCGEKPLVKGGSCLLGSLALDLYVKHPFTDKAYFDFDSFEKDTRTATRYLDEVVEEGIQYLPLEEQREAARDYRNLGVGFMGLADAYIKMGLRYGEKDAIALLDQIGKIMINAALQESALMARDLGTYRKYQAKYVLKSPFLLENATDETIELIKKHGLRNAELLSIAPNGSISTMNRGISGGIEPHFMFSFTRKTESLYGEDTYYKVYAPVVKDYMELHGIKKEEDLPDFFVNAMTLDYRKRIDTQAAIQKYIDSSISSTVNVPEEFTVEDVEDLYMYAWEQGLKGVTIFRDNCARIGILTATKDDEEELEEDDDLDCST